MKGSQRFSFKLIYYAEIAVLTYHTCVYKKRSEFLPTHMSIKKLIN